MLSIGAHLILSAVDIAEAVRRKDDRRFGIEAGTCSDTRAGADIELLPGFKIEADTFVVNLEYAIA
jgi:hypothetical protein